MEADSSFLWLLQRPTFKEKLKNSEDQILSLLRRVPGSWKEEPELRKELSGAQLHKAFIMNTAALIQQLPYLATGFNALPIKLVSRLSTASFLSTTFFDSLPTIYFAFKQ